MAVKYRLVYLFLIMLASWQTTAQTRINMTGQNPAISESSGIRALIFGISGYKKLPLEKQLEYADDDAIGFYQFLLDRPDIIKPQNITALFNAEASGQQKIRTLIYDAVVRESKPGDLVIIYFTGHGDVQKFSNGKEEAFLLFHDVNRNGDYLAPGNDALSVRALQHYISLAPDGVKVLLITDACRSGKLLDSKHETSLFLSAVAQKWEQTYKMVSCQPNQLSYENKKWGGGHGVFSFYLLWALKGIADANNDQILQLYEIYDFVKKHVQQETNFKQIPKVLGDETANLFPVNMGMKKQALQKFESESTLSTPYQATSLMLRLLSSGAKGFGNHYFFGLSPARQYQLRKFKQAIEKEYWLPGDIDPAVSKRNLRIKARFGPVTNFKLYSFAVSPDGKMAALGGDSDHIFIVDPENKSTIRRLPHRGVLELLFSRDGQYLFSGGWDNQMKIWDVSKGELVFSEVAQDNDIRTFAYGNSLPVIATAGDGSGITFYHMQNFKKLDHWPKHHEGRVTSMIFKENDSAIYTAGKDGGLYERKITDGAIIDQMHYHSAINDIYADIGKDILAAVTGDGKLLFIDPKNLQIKRTVTLSNYELTQIAGNSLSDIIFVAGKEHQIYGYDYKKQETVVKIPVGRGVNDLQLDAVAGKLFASNWNNQLEIIQFQQLINESTTNAWVQYNRLIENDAFTHLRHRLTNYFTNALHTYVVDVIQSFVNRDADLPSYSHIARARQCLKYVNKTADTGGIIHNRAAINGQLLDIYETLKHNRYKNLPDAVDQLKNIIENQPDAAYTHNTLSQVYQKLYKLKKARESSQIAASRIPKWTAPKINLGKIFFTEGKYNRSMEKFRSVISLQPGNYKGYLHLAKVYAFLGKSDSAVALAEKACRLSPQNERVFTQASDIALHADFLSKADELLQTAAEFDTIVGRAEMKLAQLYVYKLQHFYHTTGKVNFYFLNGAIRYSKKIKGIPELATAQSIVTGNIYRTAAEIYKNTAAGLKERILISCHVKSYHKLIYRAFNKFDSIIEVNPVNTDAVWGIACTKVTSGNLKKALWYIKQLDKLMPGSPVPAYFRGRINLKGGAVNDGQKALLKSIALDSLFFPAYLHLIRSKSMDKPQKWPAKWFPGNNDDIIEKMRLKAITHFSPDFFAKGRIENLEVLPYLPY